MALKYLMDENVMPMYATQLRRQRSDLGVRAVGEVGAPPKSTLDPEILIWCEEYDFMLVTNNRKSMPVHLADHLAQGHHVPGILILNPDLSIGQNLEELLLIADGSLENEYQDQIVYLPIT
jgi:Domain of unknown function (DUF5615)